MLKRQGRCKDSHHLLKPLWLSEVSNLNVVSLQFGFDFHWLNKILINQRADCANDADSQRTNLKQQRGL
jgi:hypothetical protein